MHIANFNGHRDEISTILIFVSRTIAKYCRHHGCVCPEGWEGEHCEIQVKKVSASEFAQGLNEALSGNDIVWIIIGTIICIFVILYFRRYLRIQKEGKGSNRRDRRNQEMRSFNDTRDII
jgi:hypothetical protein